MQLNEIYRQHAFCLNRHAIQICEPISMV